MEKEEIAKKFNVDLRKLELEQKKLAKTLSLKDAIDFNLADRIAGCDILPLGNRIIAVIVVLDKDMEIIEQQYNVEKASVPYISGFRAYRELPSLLACYNKLQEQPDVIFIPAHGITHPHGCGLASHFGLVIQKPVIGIGKRLLAGDVKGGAVHINSKVCGAEIKVREGSKPIYVSPGNLISLKTAVELTEKFIIKPHKLPEPLVKARKYIKRVSGELLNSKSSPE